MKIPSHSHKYHAEEESVVGYECEGEQVECWEFKVSAGPVVCSSRKNMGSRLGTKSRRWHR